MQFQQLLIQPDALPTAPWVVCQLMDTFEQDPVDTARVARLIETDPVLTARLLQSANSAFFGLVRPVAGAQGALQMLGLVRVRALVIAAALAESFHRVGGVHLDQFWRYSLHTAQLARQIALPIRIDEASAYTAGLLHGVGELVMHAGMPETMLELDRRVPMLDLGRARAQRRALGYSFADVGAALAREWRLPKRMVQAIQYQAAPFDGRAYEPLSGVLHIASWRARAQEQALSSEQLIGSYPDPVGLVLGIDPDSFLAGGMPAR
jgi:HD-like signal output (HDOD) protein